MDLIKSNGNLPRTEEEKQEMIEKAASHYANFLTALGFDWANDVNMADTPRRVAKAWVNDLVKGCVSEPPKVTAFDNEDEYDGMVFQGNIKLISLCSHHNLSFTGKAHVAYIPAKDGKVIGLSKMKIQN